MGISTENNNRLLAPEATPAYRQFWPWFLFALPASAVIAGIVTLWIANSVDQNDFLQGYKKVGLAVVTPSNPTRSLPTPTKAKPQATAQEQSQEQ